MRSSQPWQASAPPTTTLPDRDSPSSELARSNSTRPGAHQTTGVVTTTPCLTRFELTSRTVPAVLRRRHARRRSRPPHEKVRQSGCDAVSAAARSDGPAIRTARVGPFWSIASLVRSKFASPRASTTATRAGVFVASDAAPTGFAVVPRTIATKKASENLRLRATSPAEYTTTHLCRRAICLRSCAGSCRSRAGRRSEHAPDSRSRSTIHGTILQKRSGATTAWPDQFARIRGRKPAEQPCHGVVPGVTSPLS
jgi:hypothetical protein